MERVQVYTIPLRDEAETEAPCPDPETETDHCYADVKVQVKAGEPPKLLTPTSDYDSDAPVKSNGVSQSSTISSAKQPRFQISQSEPARDDEAPPRGILLRRPEPNEPLEDADNALEAGLTPRLLRPASDQPCSRSLLSQANGDLRGDGDTVPRVMRLKAKAPTVAINDQSGDVEKQNLFDDNVSTCRSYRSLNSSKVGVDRGQSVTFPGVVISTDPFWQMRLRNVQPPKHPRLKRAGHYCRKFMAFMCSHVGLFVIVAGYTTLGGFIFPALENERALGIRQEIFWIRFRTCRVDK